ncbi:MAG TPA: adenosine deaminase [Terriglobales bacterium]|nr:adenosine deaminase [Terriglobales bacterium]
MQKLPKVELHLHLDCSLSFALVSRLKPSVTREEFDREFIAPARCTNLADFLLRPPKCIALMQTESQLQASITDLFQQLQQDNIIYAEIRFAPFLHRQKGLRPEEVVEIVDTATAAAEKDFGIHAGLLLCTLRHYSAEESLATAKLVERFHGRKAVALDIAGDEAGFPIDAHIPAFNYAKQRNLGRVAHAGEARGADSVWETLESFDPSRIGHGVRSMEDPVLMQHLKEKGIHLEVCPSSNVQISMYERYQDHPVGQMEKSGVSFNINTDSRTVNNLSLTDEYEKMSKHFGWGPKQFLATNLNAVNASFAGDPIKRKLRATLKAAYAK